MVHALTKVHGMLGKNGRLIDIHPQGTPTPIDVRVGQTITTVGWLREEAEGVDYLQASAAIDATIARKLFALEQEGTFDFITVADSLVDLRAYLKNERTDTYMNDPAVQQIRKLMKDENPDQEIIMRNVIRVLRLRRLNAKQLRFLKKA